MEIKPLFSKDHPAEITFNVENCRGCFFCQCFDFTKMKCKIGSNNIDNECKCFKDVFEYKRKDNEVIMAKWGTKNPPKHKGRYLVTVYDDFFGYTVRQADRCEYPKGNWYWDVLPSGNAGKVIAWQKQPEPYKGE